MHIGSAWRYLDPSPNEDIIVLLLGDRPLVLRPDGVGVDDGVEWKSVGGTVPLPLGTVHPEVETGHEVPLLSPRRDRKCAVVVVNPFQE